jgi:hypothetical protein
MVVVGAQPLLRFVLTAPRCKPPRADILDELKYQLSNSDEGTRPTSDLVENPVAAAYLAVLVLFGAGLAYLLWSDTQATARKEAAFREQMAAAEMLRAQGLDEEAAVLDRDLKKQRKPNKPAAEKPKGLAADPYGDDSGNRFERRQGRAAKRKKSKKGKK